MKTRFNPQAGDLQRLQVGPIGPHLQSFAALVSQQGYCNVNGWLKIRLVAKLSRWLHQRRIPLNELNEARIAAFLNARWKRLARHSGDQITMTLLLRHLRQAKVVAPPPLTNGSDLNLMILEYQGFLLSERSLMASTTGKYLEVAHRFLSRRFPDGKLYLKKLRAGDITDFALHDTSNRGRRSAQLMATVLRSFLSFLLQKGRIANNLAAVVPSIPHQCLAGVPRYLEAREVEMVLRSCDRRRKIGKRDYAIFLLLARLGLRANEVVQLTLDDIDWRAGELLIRGKGARVDRLPLLQDVGQALADYLKNARPVCSSRRLFIQCRAPLEGFAGPGCVSNLVRWALLRLHLCPQNRGAHVLRHSLATGMLRNGASLAQIGQVLRHQLPQTTEIYAKVDFNALRALALPWTGGAL
jgi:site-specific recombinase XerD